MSVKLLELTYKDLVALFAKRYDIKAPLAAELYREFYKQLNPRAWNAAALEVSP